jgi:flavorubredoxin
LSDVPVSVIAPSHGLVWRENPAQIVTLYQKWAEYAAGPTEAGVTLLYASMYGNTETMMNAVARGVSEQDLPVDIYDVTRTHVSYILPSLWTQRGVIVGAPTYEGGLFPPMADALNIARQKRIRNKQIAYFGSYGWSGGARRELEKLAGDLKWDLVDAYEFQGGPTEEALHKAARFGARFGKLIQEESR